MLGVEWEYYGTAIAMVVLFCMVIWVGTSEHRRERTVSKRRIQTRHRREREDVCDVISIALEQAVMSGKLKRNTVDVWYKKLSSYGLKDLGYEPSFGRPWYKRQPINLSGLKNKLKAAKLMFKPREVEEESLSTIAERHRRK